MYEKILGQTGINIAFVSDLIGICIDMPVPLGKNKYKKSHLFLSLEYYGNKLVYSMHYDKKLHMVLLFCNSI